MSRPRISVIIPVYNAEPYLRRCLDSVQGQTYENLEILLVNDGSTDGSRAVCDEYAARDSRIRVLHKENGGVSSARNAGLAAAAGEWIGWVDSDDWIEPDMFAYLLAGALESGADVAVCSRSEEYKSRSTVQGWSEKKLLDTEQALSLLLEDGDMKSYLWDKLWKRELFRQIVFPEGRAFEDVAVLHRLFARAERIVCLPGVKYHYGHHADSLFGSATLKNRMDYYLAAEERYADLLESWPQFREQLEGQCVCAAKSIWSCYLGNSREEREKYRPAIRKIAENCRRWKKSALESVSAGPMGRAVICLTPYDSGWAFALAWLCGQLYKAKHGRML